MISRALLCLLVVLNLGVALWWIARGDAAVPERSEPSTTGVARLALASEVAEPLATPAPAAPVTAEPVDASDGEAVPPVAAGQCRALGPFADAGAAEAARRALPASVTRSRLRQAVPSNAGWRVMLPAQADRAAATAMAERIRQAGFDDLYVVAEGEDANSIALGRFGSEASARAHAAALRAAGFEVASGPVGNVATHWLDVMFAEGSDAASIQGAAGARSAERLDCGRMR